MSVIGSILGAERPIRRPYGTSENPEQLAHLHVVGLPIPDPVLDTAQRLAADIVNWERPAGSAQAPPDGDAVRAT